MKGLKFLLICKCVNLNLFIPRDRAVQYSCYYSGYDGVMYIFSSFWKWNSCSPLFCFFGRKWLLYIWVKTMCVWLYIIKCWTRSCGSVLMSSELSSQFIADVKLLLSVNVEFLAVCNVHPVIMGIRLVRGKPQPIMIKCAFDKQRICG